MLYPSVEDVHTLYAGLDGIDARLQLREHAGGDRAACEDLLDPVFRDALDKRVLLAEHPVEPFDIRQVHQLLRPESGGECTGCSIGVDVVDLSVFAACNRCDDRDVPLVLQAGDELRIDLGDISDESEETLNMYGDEVRTPGTFAANCLRARRLAERGVRFIQLYQPSWDHHGNLPNGIRNQCRITDQPSAALIQDLKQRGMLKDTLVIWGGEFGRTSYCQGKIEAGNFGRDHHPRCFTMWMAGGGVNAGHTHGETDDFSYNITSGGVHIHDLHATVLRLLGMDHERLTYKYQGRYFRLTDVHGRVVKELLA